MILKKRHWMRSQKTVAPVVVLLQTAAVYLFQVALPTG